MTRSTEMYAKRKFVAFMVPDEFEETLILPKAICKELESVVPRKAKLKRGSGAMDVSITMNILKGYYQFDEGWTDFLEHHNIEGSDILLFEHTGCMNFDVGVFNKYGNERTMVNSEKDARRLYEQRLDQHTRPADVDDLPHFRVYVTQHTKYSAFISRSFCSLTQINLQTEVSVRNEKGFIWQLKVQGNRPNRVKLSGGWLKFYNDNQLKVNDVLMFSVPAKYPISKPALLDVKIKRATLT